MIVTLLSDYGYQDHYVSVAKAIVHSHIPDVKIFDLSHDVTPHHLLQAVYLLDASRSVFPEATIHLSLFRVMYTLPARVLVTELDRQFIISSDSGLLPLLLHPNEKDRILTLPDVPSNTTDWIKQACNLALSIRRENALPGSLVPYEPLIYPVPVKPVYRDNKLECNIVHVDRFGNVVLNITKSEFEEYRSGRDFRISIRPNEYIDSIHVNYSDVRQGEKLCLFNDAGYLEIAINQASAANLLGLRLYDEVSLIYRDIKIQFQ